MKGLSLSQKNDSHTNHERKGTIMYNEKTVNAVTPLKQSEKTALLLSVEDLMPLLAIGKSSAYALVRSGQIRSIRIGKKYRIPREAVTEFISKCL